MSVGSITEPIGLVLPMTLSLRAHLLTQEDHRDDGDDGDECEDECVFGETLAIDVLPGLTTRAAIRRSWDN